MSTGDIVGAVGVTILLVAFLLNITNHLRSDSRASLILNGVGAALSCFASVLINFPPFIVLEGVWCLAAIAALARTFFKASAR